MVRRQCRFLLACGFVLCLPAVASAKPAYKKALADHLGSFLVKKLNDCRTCHLSESTDEDEKPRNKFGERLEKVKKTLQKEGKKTDIISRLEAVAEEDSDGDSVGNLLELLSGHGPGDAQDKPTAAETAEAGKKLTAFRKNGKVTWSPFETVRRPALPPVKNANWGRNPIDAFLQAEHERLGLKPRPEAPRHILLRRVYLDLVGLPPTPEELHAFLADTSPDAYEKVVDRLLASPRHGERWGRHWMDVWRYSDWAGFKKEVRESVPHIWHWRDWIIESVNADKGYDRMIQEMLAGDELAPDDPKTLRATGFLARNWNKFNRNTWLENVVEHTSKPFLGMTMNCARCHDHFFDAISQKEYYQFRAIFEPYDVRTDRLPGVGLEKDGIPRVYDARLDAPTYLFVGGSEANPDKSAAIPPGVPVLLAGSKYQVQTVQMSPTAICPEKRDFVAKDMLDQSKAGIEAAKKELGKARNKAAQAVAHTFGSDPLTALVFAGAAQKAVLNVTLAEVAVPLTEARCAALSEILQAEQLEQAGKKDSAEWVRSATAASSQQKIQAVLEARRSLHTHRLALVSADAEPNPNFAKVESNRLNALNKAEAEARKPATTAYKKREMTVYPATSSGRRLALARWITDRQNPLAARVAMNHVWLRHFGKALVPSVFDFGKNGQSPTHPALLDWLAAEFMDRNWSLKQMHRLIVTSTAYRLDCGSDQANLALDTENKFVWRMNSRRIEGEIVRDSVLYVAGNLDLTQGGPDIDHELAISTNRRSVFYRHALNKQAEFLALFDAASVTECYQRSESIVPQQALALANSPLALDQSRLLARKLSSTCGDKPTPQANAAFILAAFEHILGRTPTPLERSECEKFLAEQANLVTDKSKLTVFAGVAAPKVEPSDNPHQRARESLVHVLFNHNDFVTIR